MKYLPISLVSNILCIYYVRVSKYPFYLFISEHLFIFQLISCACAYLFIIFVSEHLFLYQWLSYARVYLFIILVFKHVFGFFQWFSSTKGNLFWCNIISNKHHSNTCHTICFHVCNPFACCSVHGRRQLDERKHSRLCLCDTDHLSPSKLYTRKELVIMETYIDEFHTSFFVTAIKK